MIWDLFPNAFFCLFFCSVCANYYTILTKPTNKFKRYIFWFFLSNSNITKSSTLSAAEEKKKKRKSTPRKKEKEEKVRQKFKKIAKLLVFCFDRLTKLAVPREQIVDITQPIGGLIASVDSGQRIRRGENRNELPAVQMHCLQAKSCCASANVLHGVCVCAQVKKCCRIAAGAVHVCVTRWKSQWTPLGSNALPAS